eukprot:TRINITY_DN10610_c0_g1_i1.p1 TRINITY_DN10610_c0_g1~~TRINITY_DN10610_c0_g1_i1.p1  ORF type:complete len:577 (-),score=111.79 TRINITY_DN10610_c0_g1_i1:254-1984(-)
MRASELADACAICLQELQSAGCCKLDPCNHVFHEACVNGMRRFGTADRCPKCREVSKDLTTASQIFEEALVSFVRKDYDEAHRLCKDIVHEIDPSHEKALELLVYTYSIKGGKDEASDIVTTLNAEHPDRGFLSLQEFDELADLGPVLVFMEEVLIAFLRADRMSRKTDALQEFNDLADQITSMALLSFNYSCSKAQHARATLVGTVVARVVAYFGQSLCGEDTQRIVLTFVTADVLLKASLAGKLQPGAAQAALAGATASALIHGSTGLVLAGAGAQVKIVGLRPLDGQLGTVVQRISTCNWKILVQGEYREIGDEYLRPAKFDVENLPTSIVPWEEFLPASHRQWTHDAGCKLAFTAVIHQISSSEVLTTRSASIASRCVSSSPSRSRNLEVDSCEDIVAEQTAIHASLQTDVDDAGDSPTETTGLLTQILHDKASAIDSMARLQAEKMSILEIRRYQQCVTDKLLQDPDLSDCYQELPGGAKYFGPADQYHPLLRALKLQDKELKFNHVVVTRQKESNVCSAIKAIRSALKVRIVGKMKMKTCPTVVKGGFIHVELPSSMYSGPRSSAFTAPP